MKCPNCNYNNPRKLKIFDIEGQKYCLCQRCGFFIEINPQSNKTTSSIQTTFKLLFIWMILSYMLGGLKFILIPVLIILLWDILSNDSPLIFLRIGIFVYIAIIIIQQLINNQTNQIR